MRRIVTLQRQQVTRDSYGGQITAWGDVEDLWAHVNVTGVSESFENNAKRDIPLRNAQITIRWRDDVSEIDRIVYDGLAWDIEGIEEIGCRVGLTLHVQTDVSRSP